MEHKRRKISNDIKLNYDILLHICRYIPIRFLSEWHRCGILKDSYFVNMRNADLHYLIEYHINLKRDNIEKLTNNVNNYYYLRSAIEHDNMYYFTYFEKNTDMSEYPIIPVRSFERKSEKHPLILAIKYDNIKIFNSLMKDYTDNEKNYIMVTACEYGSYKIVRTLMYKYNFNISEVAFENALHHNNILIIKLLLQELPVDFVYDKIQYGEYFENIIKNIDFIKIIIQYFKKNDIEILNNVCYNLLYILCCEKNTDNNYHSKVIYKELSKYIDFTCFENIHDLFEWACINKHTEIVDKMLDLTYDEININEIDDNEWCSYNHNLIGAIFNNGKDKLSKILIELCKRNKGDVVDQILQKRFYKLKDLLDIVKKENNSHGRTQAIKLLEKMISNKEKMRKMLEDLMRNS
jgi:hypothetical protein